MRPAVPWNAAPGRGCCAGNVTPGQGRRAGECHRRARELLPGDRELQPVYHLTVTAISPSPVDVAVLVLDANDNDPVFERQTYDVTMVETDGASRSAI